MNIGLLFDMNGVIIINQQFHCRSWQITCEKYGKPLSEVSYLNGRTLDEVVQFIFEPEITIEKIREIGEEKGTCYRNLYQKHLAPTPGLMAF